jgi:hypothetical protein
LAKARRAGKTAVLRDEIFPKALLLAWNELWNELTPPRRIRFGRRWITDESGRARSIVPIHLRVGLALRWLRQEVRNAAEAILLDKPYPWQRQDFLDAAMARTTSQAERVTAAPTDFVPKDRRISLDEAELERYRHYGRDFDLFPTPESQLARKKLILTLDAAASPQETALLRLLRDGASPAEARVEMGISQTNCRQILHSLRKKAMGLS